MKFMILFPGEEVRIYVDDVLTYQGLLRGAHLDSEGNLNIVGQNGTTTISAGNLIAQGHRNIGRVVVEAVHARWPMEWYV